MKAQNVHTTLVIGVPLKARCINTSVVVEGLFESKVLTH